MFLSRSSYWPAWTIIETPARTEALKGVPSESSLSSSPARRTRSNVAPSQIDS